MNPPTASHRQPRENGADDDASYRTALRGASLAFQRTGNKATPAPPAHSNGALLAATSVSSRSPPRINGRLSHQTTGNSVQSSASDADVGDGSSRFHRFVSEGVPDTPLLKPPGKSTSVDPKSPSFIAATLAASRSASPSPRQLPQQYHHPYAQQAARRGRINSIGGQSAASSVTSLDLALDTSPLPSTNSLISIFEGGDNDMDPLKKRTPKSSHKKSASVASPRPKLRPITPPRALSPTARHQQSSPTNIASSPLAGKPQVLRQKSQVFSQSPIEMSPAEGKKRPPVPPPARITKNEVDVMPQLKPSETNRRQRPSTPPPKPIKRENTVILSPQPRRSASQKIIIPEQMDHSPPSGKKPPPALGKPKPPKPRAPTLPPTLPSASKKPIPTRAKPVPPPRRRASTASDSSNDTFVSASSAPSPEPGSPRRRSPSSTSEAPFPPPRPCSAQSGPGRIQGSSPPPPLPQRQKPMANIPFDSMTNAIMAGSLASSRLTPAPSRLEPPTPPSRRQTPKIRQTLRQPPSKSDDEANARGQDHHRRKKHHIIGPSKKRLHQEGARKRWREEITPRERKRYEGVWASNRGLLLGNPDAMTERPGFRNGEVVVNVVVRDIWSRSRLPPDELAEVWDLVVARWYQSHQQRQRVSDDDRDRQPQPQKPVMALDRAEFVVGMWLIDQRLRGRKIPQTVGESVWSSAQGVVRPKSRKTK